MTNKNLIMMQLERQGPNFFRDETLREVSDPQHIPQQKEPNPTGKQPGLLGPHQLSLTRFMEHKNRLF